MAQIAASHPNTGDTWEMNAIAAVVLGGTSMAGGVGTIGGTVIGAFVIGIINDGMTMWCIRVLAEGNQRSCNHSGCIN